MKRSTACRVTTPTWNHKPSGKHRVMNSIKRLWQWDRDRRVERQALKGHDAGRGSGGNRPEGPTPLVGIAEDARLRWLIKSGRR
jgi:hypothetical protein